MLLDGFLCHEPGSATPCMTEFLFAYFIVLIVMANCSLLYVRFNIFEMIVPQKCFAATIF